jgi:hypothetical protein
MDGNTRVVELAASSTSTTTNVGAVVDLGTYVRGRAIPAFLQVSAASGTLDVAIQESTYTSGGFAALETAAAFTQVSAAGNEQIWFTPKKRYIKLVRTIAGTGATFTDSAVAVAEKLIA